MAALCVFRTEGVVDTIVCVCGVGFLLGLLCFELIKV